MKKTCLLQKRSAMKMINGQLLSDLLRTPFHRRCPIDFCNLLSYNREGKYSIQVVGSNPFGKKKRTLLLLFMIFQLLKLLELKKRTEDHMRISNPLLKHITNSLMPFFTSIFYLSFPPYLILVPEAQDIIISSPNSVSFH